MGDGVLSKIGWCFCLSVGLASVAWAQGPEGSGSLDLSGTYIRPYSPSSYGTPYSGDGLRLDWGLPLSAGLGLRGDFRWFNQGSSYTGSGYFYVPSSFSPVYAPFTDGFTSNDYAADLLLDLYVGGLRGKPFIPGRNANADGWLRRLSLTLGFHFHDFNFLTGGTVGAPVDQSFTGNQFGLGYGVVTGMTLPLAAWLSIGGSGTLDLSTVQTEDSSGYDGGSAGGGYGGEVAVDVFAHLYVNLLRGAGADTAQPFVPHYGRLGQMMIGLRAERVEGTVYGNPGTDSYGLSVGAPLSASLAAGLELSATNHLDGGALYTDITKYPTQVTLHLAWAFGKPAGRVAE
jgi:hypothetical protein